MNERVILGQVLPNLTSPVPNVIRLAKPQNDQAVVVTLTAGARIDFSAIAGENITLVRDGDRLVILFDNGATLALEPFYLDGQPLQDITFDLGSDRVVSAMEFAAQFPISTDPSVLPAAGNVVRSSGNTFSAPGALDELDAGNPLALLGADGPAGTGPQATSRLIGVTNTVPRIGAVTDGFADDEGLANGIAEGIGDTPGEAISITASLNIDFGQDVVGRALSFSASQPGLAGLVAGGIPVEISITTLGGLPAIVGHLAGTDPGDVAGRVFTVTLDAAPIDGGYVFTLLKPIDHPIAGTEDSLVLTVAFAATDGNGDTASGTFRIFVNDDAPELAPAQHGVVDEDGLSGGARDSRPGDAIDADLDGDGDETTFTGSLGIGWGADGAPGQRLLSFTDTAAAAGNITLADPAGNPLDPGGLASGGTPVLFHLIDDRTLIAYTGALAPNPTVTDPNVVFSVVLDDAGAGSYAFALRKAIDHPLADSEDDLVFGFAFTVSDFDGDTVSGRFEVAVDDDSPRIGSSDHGIVDEDGLPDGAGDSQPGDAIDADSDGDGDETTFTGSLDIGWGADGAPGQRVLSFADTAAAAGNVTVTGSDGNPVDLTELTSNGAPVLVHLIDDRTLIAYTGALAPNPTVSDPNVVFSVILDDGDVGSYAFVLHQALDHPFTDSEDDLTFGFTFKASDFDGDTFAGAFEVTVDDDRPGQTGNVSATVDEAGFGIPNGVTSIVIAEVDGTASVNGAASGFALQGDGKILVAGDVHGDFLLLRYNADLSRDASFGNGGVVTTDIAWLDDSVSSITVQGDGKILVAGYSSISTFSARVLVRYNADGSLDTDFGDRGFVSSFIPPLADNLDYVGTAVTVQPDGKILVGGYGGGFASDFTVTRYNADGSHDIGFGTDGTASIDIGGVDHVRGMVLQPDGKILVAGSSFDFGSGKTKIALVRYNADGTPDAGFGQLGIVADVPGLATSVILQADGKILVAGGSGNGLALLRYLADGTLDASFGTGGIVGADLGDDDISLSITLQPDGKILLASGSDGDFALLRYLADGSLDTSFGSGGIVKTDLGAVETAPRITLQPDGKILLAGTMGNNFALVRYNADGSLDTSFVTTSQDLAPLVAFGADGPAASGAFALLDASTLDAGSPLAVIAVDENGAPAPLTSLGDAVHFTGFTSANGVTTLTATAGGALHTDRVVFTLTLTEAGLATFALHGVIDHPAGDDPGSDEPEAFADRLSLDLSGLVLATDSDGDSIVLDDGRFVIEIADQIPSAVAGASVTATVNQANVTLSNGTGIVTVDNFGEFDTFQDVAVQPDGKILAAGYSGNNLIGDFVVVRFNPDLSLDQSFGVAGIVTTDLGGADLAYGLALLPDGRILLTGHSDDDIALARYHADGTPDTSFGTGGIVTTAFGGTQVGNGVVVQPDGKVLVAGGSGGTVLLARYDADGAPDATFGTAGIADGNVAGVAKAVALQPDGTIVVTGQNNGGDVVLARYLADGSPDTGFNGSGFVTTDLGAAGDTGEGVTLQPDGKILVAGTLSVGNTFGWQDFALVRYNADGSRDMSFGTDGIVITNISPHFETFDLGLDVALQPDGKILVAGLWLNGDQRFALVRYNADGSLDTDFGLGGIVLRDIGSEGHSIALQEDGRILVVGHSGLDFAVARYNADGTLDTGFASVTRDLTALVAFGADGPAAGGGFGLAVLPVQDSGLASGGEPVKLVSDGTTLTGFLDNGDDTPVFTLTVSGDGIAKFTLLERLDGDGPLALDFGAYVVATDRDGDANRLDDGQFVITVERAGDPVAALLHHALDAIDGDQWLGTDQSDIFAWLPEDLDGSVDEIPDFVTGLAEDSDMLDLSALLAGIAGDKADHVRFADKSGNLRLASESGPSSLEDGDLMLQIDAGTGWTDVAVLRDTGANLTAGDDAIRLLLDSAQQTATV